MPLGVGPFLTEHKMKKILLSLLMIPALAFAQWQPTKPIEAIIAWTPGSVNELTFRVLAREVEQNTGAKFIVINKPGAGGVLGTEELSKRPADGYAVTVVSVPGIGAMDKIQVPEFGKGRSYTTDSFIYPTHVAQSPFAVIAHPSDTVKTPKQFVEAIKTEKATIAAVGGARLVYEALVDRLKLTEDQRLVRVEHKGPVDSLNDVAGGHVRFAIIPSVVANSFYQAGKVNIVALSGPPPMRQLPGTGLLGDALPGFDISGAWALMIPAGSPLEVVTWYQKEFTKALKSDAVKTIYYDNLLLERTDLQTPDAFKTWLKAREKQWQPLVDNVLIKINK
jgi:tripartite-type tricarboxylate transporter receptor subunit TctC